MKKLFITFNLILSALIVMSDFVYTTVSHTILAKGITSALFVIMGGLNLFFALKTKSGHLKFAIMMVTGLFFAMLGDILLEVIFEAGAGLFAIGHIFYFISYCQLIRFQWKDLIIGAAIFIPVTLVITIIPIFNFGGVLMEIICIAYALIISMMVGKAITNLIKNNNTTNIILTIGSILFMFSDIMLLFNKFSTLPKTMSVLCIASYYPAQAILAFSILYNAVAKDENQKESN